MAFLELEFFSQTLHTNAQLQVILPQPGSQSGWDGKTPLPVLYLLHGRGGDHSDWQRMTSVERYGEKKPLAMVMMSNLLGEYTNQRYGYPYFDYVSQSNGIKSRGGDAKKNEQKGARSGMQVAKRQHQPKPCPLSF